MSPTRNARPGTNRTGAEMSRRHRAGANADCKPGGLTACAGDDSGRVRPCVEVVARLRAADVGEQLDHEGALVLRRRAELIAAVHLDELAVQRGRQR